MERVTVWRSCYRRVRRSSISAGGAYKGSLAGTAGPEMEQPAGIAWRGGDGIEVSHTTNTRTLDG